MRRVGFQLVLRDVVGKAEVYVDGKRVAEKTDVEKKTMTVAMPGGEGVRVVSVLVEASAVRERAGLGGTVTVE